MSTVKDASITGCRSNSCFSSTVTATANAVEDLRLYYVKLVSSHVAAGPFSISASPRVLVTRDCTPLRLCLCLLGAWTRRAPSHPVALLYLVYLFALFVNRYTLPCSIFPNLRPSDTDSSWYDLPLPAVPNVCNTFSLRLYRLLVSAPSFLVAWRVSGSFSSCSSLRCLTKCLSLVWIATP
jgi:hypothetical protein